MGSISLEAHNNWALKLSNLKKLVKSLSSYLLQELKLTYKKIDSISTIGIAQKEDPISILILLEFVVYTIVNSPYKEEFIKKIMELDVDCQTQFMYFIQKSLGESDSPLFDPSIKVENREVLILRTEKQRMAVRIEELVQELKKAKADIEKLVLEKEELGLIITDLKSEMSRKFKANFTDANNDSNELELKITEKDVKIMQLVNQINEMKNCSEKETSRLKDELDVANSKIIKLAQMERTMEQYKKNIENLSSAKIKLKEIQKVNEELKEKIEIKDLEIENIGSLKKNLKILKDEVTIERKNSESLSYKLDNLKKEMKKKETELEEFKEKLLFTENKLKELEFDRRGIDSPQNSEDSSIFIKFSDIDELKNTSDQVRRETRQYTGHGEIEQARKEKLILQHRLNKSKAKSKAFRESYLMVFEEMSQRYFETSRKIKQLEGQLTAISTQLQNCSQKLSDVQNEQFKYQQALYEIEMLKNNKESLMNEFKKLYEEKDNVYKKFIDSREEIMVLQTVVSEKENLLRNKELTDKILNDKIIALIEKEKLSSNMIESLKKQKTEVNEDYRIKFIEVERENISLKNEKSGILLRLVEKDRRIEEVVKEKNEAIRSLEHDHKEAIDRLKRENDRRTTQIMNQCDEAINELQKERELVEAQLKFEKINAMQEWKKSMNIEWMQNSKEELGKLKEDIVRKDKEINKLIKTNKEIKKCWKDTTKLLKAVWKELGVETQKIQNAAKRYN